MPASEKPAGSTKAGSRPPEPDPAVDEIPSEPPASDESAHRSGGGPTFVPSRIGMILVAILTCSVLFLGGYTLGAHVAATPGTPASEEARFAPFWDVYNLINSSFAGATKPTQDQLVRGAIKGMMETLNDPYSYYESPEAFQSSLLNVGGQQIGVGILFQLQPVDATGEPMDCPKIGDGCELAVVKPIEGSPAARAGIKPGDVIDAVDGVSLDGLTADQATAKIKGSKGSTVHLTLDRAGAKVQLDIVRDVFDEPVVDTTTLANGAVQYVKLTKIEGAGYTQFDQALADALAAGRRIFIVDLRGNRGGYVQDAVKLASEFLGSGPVVYQQNADGKQIELDARPGGRATDSSIRVLVLVDKDTASAAEIFAGALQARGRALLVGDRTYGKGVVQEWLPLPNNAGGIHLTIASWLTPNKVWIQGKGLQPDVSVSSDGTRAGTDPVLDAALMRLGYPAQSASTSPSPGASASPAPSTSPNGSPSPSPIPSLTPSPVPSAS